MLGLHGHAHDRGNRILHRSYRVSVGVVGEGAGLHQVLVNADQRDCVSAGHVGDVLGGAAHHEDRALDGLLVEVPLSSGLVVGAHDADLLAARNRSGEDAAEGVESAAVRRRYHLGDVHHQGALGVAVAHCLGNDVVLGALVQVAGSVPLGDARRRQVQHHHFEEGVGSAEPLAHHGLEQDLAGPALLLLGQVDLERGEHLLHLLLVALHDGGGQLDDGVHDEGGEGALEGLAVRVLAVGAPLLALDVEVVVAPELGDQL